MYQLACIVCLASLFVVPASAVVRLMRPRQGENRRPAKRILDRLLHAGLTASFLVLAFTGLEPNIGLKGSVPLSGRQLLIHITAGGVFAVCLALMVLMWGNARRASSRSVVGSLLFWAMATGGLGSVLSLGLSMAGLWGTQGMLLLADVHRGAGLVVVVTVLAHSCWPTPGQRAGSSPEGRRLEPAAVVRV